MPDPFLGPQEPCRILALSSSAFARELGQGRLAANWSVTPHVLAASAIDLVLAARDANEAFAVVILDVPAGVEAAAEKIIAAMGRADERLQFILILRGELSLPDDDRLAYLRHSGDLADLGQLVKLMGGKWLREREIDRLRVRLGETKSEGRKTSGSPAAAAEPATILVVDDDEMIRLVICQVLGTGKHRLLTACSADEAWGKWREHRHAIKLVITDINMPGSADGVALGQAMQQEDATIPVIYTSGFRAASQFSHLEEGVNYLSKPFGMSALLQVVERNLAPVRMDSKRS